jgi:serine/threonine-protein kinase PRP4
MTSIHVLFYVQFNLHFSDKRTFDCTEVRAVDGNEAVDEKDDNDSNSMDNEEAENKLDSSGAFAGEVDFTVVKSPAHGAVSSRAEALLNEGTTGVSGLGEGTPKVISFSYPAT